MALVEAILQAKAGGGADTSAQERQIDALVCDLYGLNEAERALIAGA